MKKLEGILANLEEVEEGTGVEARLLVNGIKDGRLGALVGEERGAKVELEAPCDLVVKLNLGAELVAGRPGLGQGQTILGVEILGLDVASNIRRFSIATSSDLYNSIEL